MANKKEPKAIKLSEVTDLDQYHSDGSICSSKHLWDKNGLKSEGESGLPIRFRIVDNGIKQFSSSGIFTKSQLQNAFSLIKKDNPSIKKIYNIDLIKETHGFIKYGKNSVPFTLRSEKNTVNFGVPYEVVESDEKHIIDNLNEKFPEGVKVVSRFSTHEGSVDKIFQTVKIKIQNGFISEQETVKSITIPNLKVDYLRIPCVDHAAVPFLGVIKFASFLQNTFNPESDWVHIHCHGGKGRSTTMSLIFDMFMRLENSTISSISFKDLINFHKVSGGKDLIPKDNVDNWKKDMSQERYDKLEKIYDLLNQIDQYGLKKIYSLALDVCLLHNSIDKNKLSEIVKNSGKVVEKEFYQNKDFYESQLLKLYSEHDFCPENNSINFKDDISNETMICKLYDDFSEIKTDFCNIL